MDWVDRMLAYSSWLSEQLLESAASLPESKLNEPVPLSPPSDAFSGDRPSIRSMLGEIAHERERCAAAISGHRLEPWPDGSSIEGLRLRLRRANDRFSQLIEEIRARDSWNDVFVDATRTPPETNTVGALVMRTLVEDAVRHDIVSGVLLALGVDPVSLVAPHKIPAAGRPTLSHFAVRDASATSARAGSCERTSKLSDILRRKGSQVFQIEETASVLEAIERMVAANVGALLVTGGNEITGIVTERDYLRRVTLQGRTERETLVRQIMTSPIVIATPETSVEESMALMTKHRIRHLPVVEQSEVVGVVSIRDLVEFISRQQGHQIQFLTDYIRRG
jgi:CBS domain-containing protein